MPYIIRPKGASRSAATLLGLLLALCTAPAAASAACPSTPASALLVSYGDDAIYSLLPGSSFESGASGWSLTNAQVVEEAGPVGESGALAIEPGGHAVSPAFCVSSEYPSFRFFARRLTESPGGGSLRVSLLWTDLLGVHHTTTVATLTPGTEWTLSPVLELARALPLWMPAFTLQVQLEFQAKGADGWAIDDVYIDPYSR